MRSTIITGAAALMAAQLVSAQTYTSCNPTTNSSCPSDTALGKTITVDFTKGKSDYFTEATGTSLSYDGTNGAEFIMTSETQAPTITSNFYIFFGKVTVNMKAANGTGIVSSFVMESDDLDEIDWEWLGGDGTQVESNYFGKGNTTTYDRAIYHTVSTPQDTYHDYTIEWSKESIIWSIDGTTVRTLNYADANGGDNFPQTPMVVKMGNWDGGASTEGEGTIEWAGGLTPWPGTYTMNVKSVTIEDAQQGATSYTYGDMTGSYESIEISNSTVSSSASASATATASSATASGSNVSRLVSSAASAATGSAASGSSTTSDSTTGSSPASTSDPSPPFQNPAPTNATSPSSNSTVTGSSNLTVSATPTGSSTSSKTSSSASASSSVETTSEASSKYGKVEAAVVVLGISLSFFFM